MASLGARRCPDHAEATKFRTQYPRNQHKPTGCSPRPDQRGARHWVGTATASGVQLL